MKEKFTSFLHASLLFLGGTGGYLAEKNLIAPDDVSAVNNAGLSLAGAVSIIIGCVLAHLLARGLKKLGGGSGTNLPALMITAVALSMAGALPSCSVASSAITGAPIPAVSVQRAGHDEATPFQVASVDVTQAEAEAEAANKANTPQTIHGLFDAGRAAKAVREVFTRSGK